MTVALPCLTLTALIFNDTNASCFCKHSIAQFMDLYTSRDVIK